MPCAIARYGDKKMQETTINGYRVIITPGRDGTTYCDVYCGRESANLEYLRDGGDAFPISPRTLYKIIEWAYDHGHR